MMVSAETMKKDSSTHYQRLKNNQMKPLKERKAKGNDDTPSTARRGGEVDMTRVVERGAELRNTSLVTMRFKNESNIVSPTQVGENFNFIFALSGTNP